MKGMNKEKHGIVSEDILNGTSQLKETNNGRLECKSWKKNGGISNWNGSWTELTGDQLIKFHKASSWSIVNI